MNSTDDAIARINASDAAGHSSTERATTDRSMIKRASSDQTAAEQTTVNQTTAERTTTERTVVEQDPEATDAELLAHSSAAGLRGRQAWAVLVTRHAHRMYAVARSFSLDEATAEDLVQTAWLRLLERVDQLREPGSVGPWLCTVVRNEARKLVTRRREIPVDIFSANVDDDASGVDMRIVRDERSRALRFAFARLGAECQQLLRLLVVEPPLSYDEIAAALGRPRGSLGPTRRRCLDQLKSRLPTGFEP